MKQEKIECKVPSNIKADMQSTQRLMHFKTIGDYITFCHQTTANICNIAKEQGVEMEDMQEFIDWLLDNQSFQDQIIEHAGVFVKSQKAIEEALHKD
jgi:hypothetical protein